MPSALEEHRRHGISDREAQVWASGVGCHCIAYYLKSGIVEAVP